MNFCAIQFRDGTEKVFYRDRRWPEWRPFFPPHWQ